LGVSIPTSGPSLNNKPIINKWKTLKEIPAITKESDALNKDLIKRGFKFVGSTVIYAHMQALWLGKRPFG
jgi:DNA-3-methyladenine glycosylase I